MYEVRRTPEYVLCLYAVRRGRSLYLEYCKKTSLLSWLTLKITKIHRAHRNFEAQFHNFRQSLFSSNCTTCLRMKLCSIVKIACLAGFLRETTAFTSSGFRRQAAGLIGISSRRSMIGPMETSDLILADDEGVIKVVAISLTLGGG